MNRKYFFIILAITLFCLFLIILFLVHKTPEKPHEIIQSPQPPFHSYINGVGIVEPNHGNIFIGIPFNRIVKKVNVSVNEKVKKGDVLVELEHQDLIADLQVRQKEYEKALANLNKLEALPRQEDLTIADEGLKKIELNLHEAKAMYDMAVSLPNPNAISKEEFDRRKYKFQQAEAELREAKAQYEKTKAGAWQPDLKIAQHEVEQARASVEATKEEIKRTYIKSPIDGTVLQIKIREGETPSSDPSQTTIVVGDVDELYLKVNIDQFNVSNLIPHASAVAFRQGDHSTEFPLTFVHVEPFMVPKRFLTNAVNEQVDTQVLQVLYRIEKKDSGLFVGEKMDVFIDKKK